MLSWGGGADGAEDDGKGCWSSEFFRIDSMLRAARAGQQGPLGGGFHAGMRVLPGQPDDAQATAVAHLRVRFVRHHPLEQLRGVGPDLLCPMHQARRRPLQMRLMTLGAMLMVGDGLEDRPEGRPKRMTCLRNGIGKRLSICAHPSRTGRNVISGRSRVAGEKNRASTAHPEAVGCTRPTVGNLKWRYWLKRMGLPL
jgi:hypothetical protein